MMGNSNVDDAINARMSVRAFTPELSFRNLMGHSLGLAISAPRLKACHEFIQKTNQSGGKTELLVLPEIGIKGNPHILMQDSNSIQIADILNLWIEQRIKN